MFNNQYKTNKNSTATQLLIIVFFTVSTLIISSPIAAQAFGGPSIEKIQTSQWDVLGSNKALYLVDEGQTITDFESAQRACKELLGGILPDVNGLKEVMKELGTRLRPAFYWSTTVVSEPTNCSSKECRIQVESPTLNERSEDVQNKSGAMICITQVEEK